MRRFAVRRWLAALVAAVMLGHALGSAGAAQAAPGYFGPVRFGTEMTEDGVLAGEGTSFPAGTTVVYAAWTYSQMRDGMLWGMSWRFNGKLLAEKRDQVWTGGASGEISSGYRDSTGLASGEYVLVLTVEGREVQRYGFTILPARSAGPFGAITFGRDVTGDHRLIGQAAQFPAGIKEVYGVWSYRNMRNGTTWGRVWYRDGVVMADKRNASTWDGGASGTMSWSYTEDGGLPAGRYELVLYVEGREVQRGSFTVR